MSEDRKARTDIRLLQGEINRLKNNLFEVVRNRDIEIINLKTGETTLIGTYRSTAKQVIVLCDATNGAFTVYLPSVKDSYNQVFVIKKVDSSANAITIDGFSDETIDGSTTFELTYENNSISLISDVSSNWEAINNLSHWISNSNGVYHDNGNVGINTTNPGEKLSVEGGGAADENLVRFNNQGNYISRIWLRNQPRSAYFSLAAATGDTGVATGALAYALLMGLSGAGSVIQFYTGTTATVRMTILVDGGIKLHAIKSGATQAAAGAAADELWVTSSHATLPDNVLMKGV